MMNAELIAADQQKIIIPTVYRNNYLAALKALTHNYQSDPLIRILDFGPKVCASHQLGRIRGGTRSDKNHQCL